MARAIVEYGTSEVVQFNDSGKLGHASIISGGRRYTFSINGQMNLMQRCLTFDGRHEFVVGARVSGPNVFVDCIGYRAKQLAGPHHRYATGTLFENVQSEKRMESRWRGNSGSGHGWAANQTCFYNCIIPAIMLGSPPGGMAWSIGTGKSVPTPEGAQLEKPGDFKWVLGTIKGPYPFVRSTGTIESGDVIRVKPGSLYYQQVKDRLGGEAVKRLVSDEQLKNIGKFLWAKERLKKETP